ncbi:DUF4350 domain-containing protein [Curtobacterium sp. 22159]|uniref:DUF4350 domain-containing protein n=1 Tax=Curtobacterium sp. 22159 TaxID=3453882 RepID=UPI003F82F727
MSAATAPTTPGTAGAQRTSRGSRVGFWVAIVLVGVLLAALTAVVEGSDRPAPDALDPTSATASGAKALVRVLEQRGTDVRVVDRADRIADGTVFVDDADGALDPAVAEQLARRASHVVLVTTTPATLEAFGLHVEAAAQVPGHDTVSTASCAIPAAADARRITSTGTGYRVPDGEHAPGTDLCAPAGTGAERSYGLVRTDTPAGDVTLVGTTDAFRNDTITTAGNAALALGLLGGDPTLTWYTPTPGTADAAPTLGSFAPLWVPGALALLALVAVAAGVWRGRRLGPLVVERMPVVVRAAETTEGRARLSARTRDRTHALDTLRVAAIRRTARRLGLPRSAHVDEVVRAAARATGIPDRHVGSVLVGGPVPDDRALVTGAAALDELERAVLAVTTGDRPTDHDRRGARP